MADKRLAGLVMLIVAGWDDESRRMTLTPCVWNYCQSAPAQHLVSPQCLHVWEYVYLNQVRDN